jgi:hypothetical protein
VSLNTVAAFEGQRRKVSIESVGAMRAALESAGVEFINDKRPGVRLKG